MIILSVAIPLFFVTMIGESIWIHKTHPERFENRPGYTWLDTFASLSMGVGYLIVKQVGLIVTVPLYYLAYEFRLFDIPSEGWVWWLALVFAQDFAYYWFHRMHHAIRFMWAAHVNHHSSEHYNLSTALRQSWSGVFTALPFFLPLCMLGFTPSMVATVGLLNLLYQYWIHTEVVEKIGFMEAVLMTPSHHRVHHGTQEHYLDRNHGGLLIIWDRMFGTFEPEGEKVVYGLTKNIETYNPLKIAFHEWGDLVRDVKNADSLADAWGYIFNEPGWKPEKYPAQSLESSSGL
jgi:sterol desaturase/sphingolipid hydroxylase (fatty acid hydroxylase superfamily)